MFEAPNDYSAACFRQYGMNTDDSGRYSAMYKPFHLIGLELNVSILSAVLQRRATGSPVGFNADAVAVAKRDLEAGERLDGEGGYTVWGKLMPAADSVAVGALPIGLAGGIRLNAAVAKDQVITRDDIELPGNSQAWRIRDMMLDQFR